MPQDGHDTQDGAQRAGQRWIRQHAGGCAPHQGSFLGDALSSTQPWCALALAQGFHGILVCQPDAHPTLDERLAFWHANDGIAACARRHGHGRCTDVSMDRSLNAVLLLDGKDALSVNWCESMVGNATTGAQRSPKSLSTHHRVTGEPVAAGG